jgi:hypothetical protein
MARYILIAFIVLINVGALYGAYKALVVGNYFGNAPFGAILIVLGIIALLYGSFYIIKSTKTV